jgi:uncharacterized repeat protein (TIGR01451 family)
MFHISLGTSTRRHVLRAFTLLSATIGLFAFILILGAHPAYAAEPVANRVNSPSVAASTTFTNMAGIVVVHGSNTVVTRCVEFITPTVTGAELLSLSGLQYTDAGGGYITGIDHEACTWGGAGCQWLSYWLSGTGTISWTSSALGAGSRIVHNGNLDGWQVQPDQSYPAPLRLPSASFRQICPAAPLAADIALRKTANNVAPQAGDTLTFTLTASNDGPDAASGLTISQTLPTYLTSILSATTSGTYDPVGGVWNVPSLAAGQSVTLTLSGKVCLCAVNKTLADSAELAGVTPADPNSDNDTASVTLRVSAQTPARNAVQSAATWLRSQQLADGSYSGFGGSTGATLDTVLAAAAINTDPISWTSSSGVSLIDYLRTHTSTMSFAAKNASAAGKLALGVAAANLDPHNFAGLNLVISITNYYSPTSGLYGSGSNWDQAFSILGLAAAGEPIPSAATQALAFNAEANGGWAYSTGLTADTDSTGLVIQALVAGGQPVTSTPIISALAFLKSHQASDGGFISDPTYGPQSNTNSTAFAIQGIIAAGGDPLSPAWTISGSNPISFMLSLQGPDGSLYYTAVVSESRQLATQQGIPGLAGRPFPYASRAVAQRKAIAWIRAQQQADGGFGGSGAGNTLDAVFAILSTRTQPQTFVSAAGKTPLNYLYTQVPTYPASSAAAAGKFLAGVVAAGGNPRAFGGYDLVISTTAFYSATSGQFGGNVWDQSWAMLGLAAARHTIPVTATQRLAQIHSADGGWGYGNFGAFGSDPDSTGLALMALAAGGAPISSTEVLSGLAYLHDTQNSDGGFGYAGATNANSTGLALQGLAAYGQTLSSLNWTASQPGPSCLTWHTPMEALLKQQSAAGGFAGYSGANDPSATYQALPGIAYKPFPYSGLFIQYLTIIRRNA